MAHGAVYRPIDQADIMRLGVVLQVVTIVSERTGDWVASLFREHYNTDGLAGEETQPLTVRAIDSHDAVLNELNDLAWTLFSNIGMDGCRIEVDPACIAVDPHASNFSYSETFRMCESCGVLHCVEDDTDESSEADTPPVAESKGPKGRRRVA